MLKCGRKKGKRRIVEGTRGRRSQEVVKEGGREDNRLANHPS